MKGRTCGKCGRTVWLRFDGEAWVGQCNYCGQWRAEDPEPGEEIPEPEKELVGVLVQWEDDSDDERISHGQQFFEDPDEADKFVKTLPHYFKTWVWPEYRDKE